MAKGFAIAAFVFVLLSFPVPILGNYMTLGALVLVTIAAWHGDQAWTIAVTVISGVKLFLLSPTWHFAMFGGAYMKAVDHAFGPNQNLGPVGQTLSDNATNQMVNANHFALFLTLALLAAPIAVMFFRQNKAGSGSTPVDPNQFEIG